MREQFIRNLLPAEIPKYGAEFVILVETDPVIDGKELMFIRRKEDMPALAVSVVHEQVEERNRFQEQFIFGREVEVVIIGIVFNE